MSSIALAPQVIAVHPLPDKLTGCQCNDLSVQAVGNLVCFSLDGFVNIGEVVLTCNTLCQNNGGFLGGIGVSFDDSACIPELLVVDIDLKPNSCPNPVNVFSKGLVPVAILGSLTFDVNDIDISTLPDRTQMHTIEDVAAPFGGPLIDKSSCTEDGPDGFDDLIFKIPSSELNCLSDGLLALLIIDGELLDGTHFEGRDIALVLNKKACPVT